MHWLIQRKLFDPDNPEGQTGGQEQEQEQEQETKETGSQGSKDNNDAEPQTFRIVGKDGVPRDLTEQELYLVAQEGIDVFVKKQRVFLLQRMD